MPKFLVRVKRTFTVDELHEVDATSKHNINARLLDNRTLLNPHTQRPMAVERVTVENVGLRDNPSWLKKGGGKQA